MSDYTTKATVDLDVNGEKAKQAIEEQRVLVENLRKAYAKAKAEGEESAKTLEKEYKKARRELKSMEDATLNVASVLKRLDRATPKELKTALRQLNKELNTMQRGSKAWNEHTEKIRRVKKELESVNNSLKQQQTGWQKMSSWLNKWQTMAVAAFAVVMKVVNSARKAVNAYAEMEQEMANVRKFTGMTATQVEDLNEELKEIDTRTSRQELNKLAQEAGRLGKTSKEDVLGFVRAADQINVALDDLGEGATLTLSKLTGIFGDEKRLGTEKSLLAVGSVINELSQNCSASAPYLAEFASRMGGVGAQAGMSIQQIMGFAAVLDSNNQKVEASATALSQVITRLYQDPAKYAKPAGLEVQQFSKLLREDANAAVIQLLESLNKMGNMDVLSPIFAEMGETGSRAISALSTLAGNIDEVKRQQEVANIAFSEATSISKEFDVQNNTVQAGLEKAKKKLNELSVDLGQKLLPVMKYAISSSSAIVQVLSIVVTWVIRCKEILIPAVAAIGAYWVATKVAVTWNTALNAVTKVGAALQASWTTCVGLSKVAVLALTGKLKEAKVALATLNATMKASPWGLIAAAVTAVGVAVYRAATKTDEYKESIDDAMKKANGFTAECVKEETELNKLFGKLEGTTKGTKDYNDAKNTIIKNYGKYLTGLINERGEITNLEGAYNRLTIAIRQNAKVRGIAAAREALDTTYYGGVQDDLEKLRKVLIDFGADVRQAERIVSATAEQIATGNPIPTDIQNELLQLQNQTNVGHLTGNNPVAIFNSITAKMEDFANKRKNLDDMENAVRPAKNANDLTLKAAITLLERVVEGNEEGGTISVIQPDGTMIPQFMTKAEAENLLSQYVWEQSQRGSVSGDNSGLDPSLNNTTKCPKCKKSPCVCNTDTNNSKENKDRFKVEKEWREREEALNRIARATGQKSYEEYTKRMNEIEVEFYKKQLAHTDLSVNERLSIEAQYYEAMKKQSEASMNFTIEAENDAYNKRLAEAKQFYLDGKYSTETYNEAVERIELDHLKNVRDIYAKAVNAPIEAWKKAKEEAGIEMNETFNGNVNLTARPQIDASLLKEKGWDDAGEGIATVFSSQYGIKDANGTVREILVTPILPDGTVLSEEELKDYIYNVLEGSNDILSADNKGLVIAVDVDPNGEAGEKLHQLQEIFYSSQPDVSNSPFAKDYADASSRYSSASAEDQMKRRKQTEDAKAKFKADYFGDNLSEQTSKYNADLAMLQQVYDAELQAAGDNADEKLRIEEAFENAKLLLKQKYNLLGAEEDKNAMQRATDDVVEWLNSDGAQAVTQSFDAIVSGMSAIFSQVSSLVQAELEIETAAIEKRYDKEISQAEGNAYKVKQLEEQKEKEIAKVKNEANKKMFAMQVIQAIAQTAQNALSAYGSALNIPVVGIVMAPIAAAMAVAAGAVQIAAIKKQQQASEAQGYAKGGFTGVGGKYEPAGIVHKGEWVASQELLASPVARPMINALDYAQRTNTIGSLRGEDVSRAIAAPVIIASNSGNEAITNAVASQSMALANYAETMRRLNTRLDEPFVTVNTVTGDTGIKKAQDEYDKLMRNKTPKSKRK